MTPKNKFIKTTHRSFNGDIKPKNNSHKKSHQKRDIYSGMVFFQISIFFPG
jgi:hypothetical protein